MKHGRPGTSIGSFVENPEALRFQSRLRALPPHQSLPDPDNLTLQAGASMENVAAVLGDFIGGVTLTGSTPYEDT